MVRQLPPAGPDGDVMNAVDPQDLIGRLGPGDTPAVAVPAVPSKAGADLYLGVHGEDQHRDQENPINSIVIKWHNSFLMFHKPKVYSRIGRPRR